VITHIALLRAVNVGGTGKLPMAELRAMAARLGFENPRTHIASGNLVFESPLKAAKAQALLEDALQAYAGKPVGVVMRTAAELQALIDANPFPDAAPNRVLFTLLNEAPTSQELRGQQDEQVVFLPREVLVHHPQGAGQSRLRLPGALAGTARNLNTLRALLALAARR
jgi:uncharacterized protein (DUF1697 family)